MDNQQTGRLIRELRKEKGMTQKELANHLHITDRAVSKWERGLCAPDLSLLEPLAALLGCSVSALIAGAREPRKDAQPDPESEVRHIIAYSLGEIRRKVSRARGRSIALALLCVTAVMTVCGLLLWQDLFLLDQKVSPDGTREIRVYNKALDGIWFSRKNAVSLIVSNSRSGGEWRVSYGECRYQGSWWAPDSEKYVVAPKDDGGVRLELAWLERNSSSNLSAYLSMGVEASELGKSGYTYRDGWPEIQYQFLQWGLDSASMLIYYAFRDQENVLHDGYFWYNCEECTVSAVLELSRCRPTP